MTVYTALFSDYEKLKEPQVYTPDWNYICYTDQPFKSNIWEIKKIPATNPRREARRIKALFHMFIDDPFSLWIDGSFIINCDLNEFWNKYFTAPFSAPVHPTRKCVYEEIRTVLNAKRGGSDYIVAQREKYKSLNVPENNGLITSGVLLRQNTVECRKLCEEWWHETDTYSLRDQVSFAKVSLNNPNFHTFKWDYRFGREFIYVQHNHKSNKFASVR